MRSKLISTIYGKRHDCGCEMSSCSCCAQISLEAHITNFGSQDVFYLKAGHTFHYLVVTLRFRKKNIYFSDDLGNKSTKMFD